MSSSGFQCIPIEVHVNKCWRYNHEGPGAAHAGKLAPQLAPTRPWCRRSQRSPDAATAGAVQQSPSRDFAEFGLPNLPPLLEDLVKYTLNARNFWAATPPKVSVMHYDWQDSVLLQVLCTRLSLSLT